MKKLLTILTILTLTFGCTAQNTAYDSIGVEEFNEYINSNDIVLLDVRTAEEYNEGHIANAINIDIQAETFEANAKVLLPQDKTIALYCRSGKRSKKAAEILTANGYKAIELSTGFNGWKDAGKDVSNEAVDLFKTADGTLVHLHCIKHGTVKMHIGDKWLYVDPVTDKVPPMTDYSTMPKADYILITHEHPDHLDARAIEQLTKPETKIIANHRSNNILNGIATPMANGESLQLDAWKIDAVPAYNSSADKQQFHPKGRDNGYVINVNGMKIYIAGDTEDIDEMSQLKDIDVAFLPCNLPFTMVPEQLAKAAQIIMPKVLFPYHYGQTDIQQVVTLLKQTPIDVRIRQYQ